MKLPVALALAVSWLAAANSYFQSQRARSARNEQTTRDAAKQGLREVLEQDPNDKKALFELGRLMVEDGDFVSAAPLFRKYVGLSPAEPGAWAYLLRCAAGQHDAREAADAQRQIELLAPTNFALHGQAACWLAGSGISEVTGREFELAMSLAPRQTRSEALRYSRLGQCYEHAQDPDRATRAFQ